MGAPPGGAPTPQEPALPTGAPTGRRATRGTQQAPPAVPPRDYDSKERENISPGPARQALARPEGPQQPTGVPLRRARQSREQPSNPANGDVPTEAIMDSAADPERLRQATQLADARAAAAAAARAQQAQDEAEEKERIAWRTQRYREAEEKALRVVREAQEKERQRVEAKRAEETRRKAEAAARVEAARRKEEEDSAVAAAAPRRGLGALTEPTASASTSTDAADLQKTNRTLALTPRAGAVRSSVAEEGAELTPSRARGRRRSFSLRGGGAPIIVDTSVEPEPEPEPKFESTARQAPFAKEDEQLQVEMVGISSTSVIGTAAGTWGVKDRQIDGMI